MRRSALKFSSAALIFCSIYVVATAPTVRAAPRAASPTEACPDPVLPDSVSYIDSSGEKVSQSSANTATVYTFRGQFHATLIRPPVGFDPTTASDATLSAWHFESRPTDLDVLAQWIKDFSNYRVDTSPPVLCPSPTSHAYSYVDTNIWSGVVAYEPPKDFVRAYGLSRVPGFTSTCGSSSTWADWVGIGNANLLQNGYATPNSFGSPTAAGNDIYPWFEGLSSSYPGASFGVTPVSGAGPAFAGDLVAIDDKYDTYAQDVIFNWNDHTTGYSPGAIVFYGYTDSSQTYHPAWEYYDGSQVEAVDERISYSSPTPLREFGTAGWGSVQAARDGMPMIDIGSYGNHNGIRMIRTGDPSVQLAGLPGGVMTSTSAFGVKWTGCS